MRTDLQQLAAETARRPLDMLIIGGGITGAGVLLAAAQAGLRVALFEQNDFAFGSSSRSSKLVHGGLRYLQYGRAGLTLESLRARDALLRDYPDQVQALRFVTTYQSRRPLSIWAAVTAYDALAGQHTRRFHGPEQIRASMPALNWRASAGALSFIDAKADDARLVMRVLQQAQALGAHAQNYCRAEQLLLGTAGVAGALIRDGIRDESVELRARVVINATGAWADKLLPPPATSRQKPLRLRPLRGSHLVLPWHRLPLNEAVFARHPVDKRPVYALPWAGSVLFGTTDVDHQGGLEQEPRISDDEYDYLLGGVRTLFPHLALDSGDVLSTTAGIRPTLADKQLLPSSAGREHITQVSPGFISIAGGKLTTFRTMAAQVLVAAQKQLKTRGESAVRAMASPAQSPLISASVDDCPQFIGSSSVTKAALLAACAEQVEHLDDLLLRRTRLGLTCSDGASAHLAGLQTLIAPALGWTSARWQDEVMRYQAIHRQSYSARAH